MIIKKYVVLKIITSIILYTNFSYAESSTKADLSFEDLASITGNIVEITVDLSDHTVGDQYEPKTYVHANIDRLLAGYITQNYIDFVLQDGYDVNTSEMFITEGTPNFIEGETYLIFLKKISWNQSPISYGKQGIYRKTNFGGADYMTTLDGRCITLFDASGPHIGQVISLPQLIIIDYDGSEIVYMFNASSEVEQHDYINSIQDYDYVKNNLTNYFDATDCELYENLIVQIENEVMNSNFIGTSDYFFESQMITSNSIEDTYIKNNIQGDGLIDEYYHLYEDATCLPLPEDHIPMCPELGSYQLDEEVDPT